MRCPYCGQPNPDRAHVCTRCGRRIDSVQEKRREKKIMIFGVVLIALIIAAGIGAMYAISRILREDNSTPKVSDTPNVTITTQTPTPEVTQAPEEPETDEQAPAGETPEPEQTAEEPQPEAQAQAILVTPERQAELVAGRSGVAVVDSQASSTIFQEGVDNSPYTLYDGMDWTSWQDGVDGPGIGETVSFSFDREYQVRCIVVRLGNWYADDDYFYRNNRPERLTFELGDSSFEVTFPDEKREFCIELSRDVPASQMRIIIGSVYSGYEYDDTCLNEVTIYGV